MAAKPTAHPSDKPIHTSDTPTWRPRYSGPGQTGICRGGHSADDHHGSIVMNAEYFRQTGESRVPGECEFWGTNEQGGLGPDGTVHCFNYVDAGDTTEERVDGLSVPRQDGGDDVH